MRVIDALFCSTVYVAAAGCKQNARHSSAAPEQEFDHNMGRQQRDARYALPDTYDYDVGDIPRDGSRCLVYSHWLACSISGFIAPETTYVCYATSPGGLAKLISVGGIMKFANRQDDNDGTHCKAETPQTHSD